MQADNDQPIFEVECTERSCKGRKKGGQFVPGVRKQRVSQCIVS